MGLDVGASPQVTSDAIFHAINSRTPKTRYAIGPADPDAKLSLSTGLWLFWIMPDRLKDILNKAQLEDFAARSNAE